MQPPGRAALSHVIRRGAASLNFPPLAGLSLGIGAGFSARPHGLAGDAVLIAPVSRQIPCKQGILQGKLRFQASWSDFVAKIYCAAGTSRSIPYAH
jgi:hypothetical protein